MKKEVFRFICVGALTVLIDYASYLGLINIVQLNTDISKSISFMIGTAFAYFANRLWTFDRINAANGSVVRFIFLYACTLTTNVYVNEWIINILHASKYKMHVAFIAATTVSASINFLGLKLFVFRDSTLEKKQ